MTGVQSARINSSTAPGAGSGGSFGVDASPNVNPGRDGSFAAVDRILISTSKSVCGNSERTAADVRERVGVDPARTRVVYYGSDAAQFSFVFSMDSHAQAASG